MFKVGQKVKFEDDGITYKGKVKAIHGTYLTITTSDNEEWEIETADVIAA